MGITDDMQVTPPDVKNVERRCAVLVCHYIKINGAVRAIYRAKAAPWFGLNLGLGLISSSPLLVQLNRDGVGVTGSHFNSFSRYGCLLRCLFHYSVRPANKKHLCVSPPISFEMEEKKGCLRTNFFYPKDNRMSDIATSAQSFQAW